MEVCLRVGLGRGMTECVEEVERSDLGINEECGDWGEIVALSVAVVEKCCFIVPLLWRRETRATEGIMTLMVVDNSTECVL